MGRLHVTLAAAASAAMLGSTPARAQTAVDDDRASPSATASPPHVASRPAGSDRGARDAFVWRYPTFRTSEYVATGLFGGIAIAGLVIPTDQPRWTTATGVDQSAQDALRLEGKESRKTADDASDLTLALTLNYGAFDAAVVAWALRGKGSVAYEMAAINVEVLAVTAAISSVSKAIIARERPYAEECRADPVLARADDCEPDSVNVGFISGHASISFAAASVSCMHHAYLDLYQSPAADAAACIAAYGAAGATGLLRMMSDNHYVTDVASGAAVGTLVGLGLPWLLHYRIELPERDSATPMNDLSIKVIPGPTSAVVVGVF